MGRSKVLQTIGKKCYVWPLDQIRQWIEVDLLTHAEIGDRLDVGHQLISKLCRKHGIECQRRGPRGGEGHPEWTGGRIVDKGGYILVHHPGHPMARRCGVDRKPCYVPEHRLVMAEHLGRMLESHEVVHHKNGIHDDNRIENLELFQSNADHLRHELTGRIPNWTEGGKARILAAVRGKKGKRNRLLEPSLELSEPDDPEKP